MTKKDYKLIAEVLKGQKRMISNADTIEAVRAWNTWNDCIFDTAKSLADKIKEDNENFDSIKFLEAIFNTK